MPFAEIVVKGPVGSLVNRGKTVVQACKQMGVTEQTYYRWRKEYGDLKMDQAKRLKALEKEDVRLKKLVAHLSLDNQGQVPALSSRSAKFCPRIKRLCSSGTNVQCVRNTSNACW